MHCHVCRSEVNLWESVLSSTWASGLERMSSSSAAQGNVSSNCVENL